MSPDGGRVLIHNGFEGNQLGVLDTATNTASFTSSPRPVWYSIADPSANYLFAAALDDSNNYLPSTIQVWDVSSPSATDFRMVETLTTKGAPLVVSPSGDVLYAFTFDRGSTPTNYRLLAIDIVRTSPTYGQVLGQVALPYGISSTVMTADGATLFGTNPEARALITVRISRPGSTVRMDVSATTMPTNGSGQAILSPDGQSLYVLGSSNPNPGLAVIDPRTSTVSRSNPTFRFERIALSADGSRVYSTDSRGNVVRVNLTSGLIENSFTLGPSAAGIFAITPRGTIYAQASGELLVLSDNRPAPPHDVTATLEEDGARVSWQAPLDLGDPPSPVTTYTVQSTPQGLSCSTSGALSCRTETMKSGVAYTFTVTATTSTGTSAPSPASTPLTRPTGAPAAPTSPTAVASVGSALVSWQPPVDDGGSIITGYTVTASPGGQTCSTTGALTCTVNRLANGTAYTFTVTAKNALGTSRPSGPTNSITPRGEPQSPSQLRGTPGDGRISVAWAAPASDGGFPITGYTVTASPGGQTCSTTGALTCTITGLTNGRAYFLTATATNSAGTSPSSAPSPPTTPRAGISKPGAVTALKATPLRGAIRVTWSSPTDLGGASTVSYRYRVGKGNWFITDTRTVRAPGASGATLVVTVQALNGAGPGPSRTVRAAPR